MAHHDCLGSPLEVSGFRAEESRRPDQLLELTPVGCGKILRSGIAGEQQRRHEVDTLVCGLGRQDRGHEQFERIPVDERTQLGRGARVSLGKTIAYLAGPRDRAPPDGLSRASVGPTGPHLRDGSHGMPAIRRYVRHVHHVEIKQRMGEADIAAISVLLEAASLADGHRALGEHQWLDLVQGGREGFAGFVARESGRERIVAYAQISRGNDGSWAVEYVVHPRWRAAGADLQQDLLQTALGEISARGGGHVHLWVPKPTTIDDAVAEAVGMRRGRDLVQMRRALPISNETAAISVRPFRTGEDELAWLEVNNRAFRGHPEQGSWDLATLVDRERQPWFDPSGFLLHEIDGRLAGFCWTKIHEPEDGFMSEGIEHELGEIYVIAVDPDFQGRGLGRQLVLAGLASLWDRGVDTGMLYVDHDNEGARKLYFSLGFFDDHIDRAYVSDVPATEARGQRGAEARPAAPQHATGASADGRP